MSEQQERRIEGILEELMQTHGLSLDTTLYRATQPHHLSSPAEEGGQMISANDHPTEAVVDVYKSGHLIQAESLAPGLAFVEDARNEWLTGDAVCVAVRLGDVIDQGGLIYPVESVTTHRTWFLTLPQKHVLVRHVDPEPGAPSS